MTKLDIIKLAKTTKDTNIVAQKVASAFPGYVGLTNWDTVRAFGNGALDRDTNLKFSKWLKL